mgnify:CR=1 FL=1
MAQIIVERSHNLGRDAAREKADELAARLAREFGVRTLVSAHGAPMQVPHTRPTGLTAYASDERLIADHASVFGTMQVPGSVDGLAHLRFGEEGFDTIGFAVHVPGYLADREMLDGTVAALHALSESTGIQVPMDGLEERAAVNRRELDELVEQNKRIERMQLQLKVLARRQEELSGQAGIAEDEAPPPHY